MNSALGQRLPNAMTPQQYVEDKAAKSGSSFYYAFLFVPLAKRQWLKAFYAFCREVDDVVDESLEPSVAAAKLAWWRGEVSAAFAGHPSHPVMQALLPQASHYGVTEAHVQAVIAGCQMDLDQSRYLDYAGLQHYCDLVAGMVGEVTARVFGHSAESTLAYAHRLGLALQLTNIIRDVGDDARRGRIYLPLSELKQFDVKPAELLMREAPWGYSPRFAALMRFQSARAHRCYDEALALLPEADRAAQKVGLMMANIYRALLREIEADDFAVLHQRTSLTPLRKLWIGMLTHWRGR